MCLVRLAKTMNIFNRDSAEITKADVINHLEPEKTSSISSDELLSSDDRPEKRVPMSRLRSTTILFCINKNLIHII